jgi:hypothetical protein
MEYKIRQNLHNQIDRVFGSNYLGDMTQLEKTVKSSLRLSVYFQMPVCFAFIFGALFFPAVCLIAASTRSAGKTINLLQSLKIIKKLGFDYVKILMLSLVFLTVSLAVAVGAYLTLSYFDLAFGAILSGLTAGSLSIFYFWLVFSQIIGISLFKKQPQEII